MHEFFIYQEYGAKYEKMMQDINATSETMSNWEAYQKGFERLATTFSSTNTQSESPRKSLTLNDLLIKVRSSPKSRCSLLLTLDDSHYNEFVNILSCSKNC